jgi:hypothetical protein
MNEMKAASSDCAEESKTPEAVDPPKEDKPEEKSRLASPEPEYPGGVQVAIIMTCILSAIFLMSLVSQSQDSDRRRLDS